MARGLPIVTTPVGAEGLAVKHGQHLMICNHETSTMASILTLLEHDEIWTRLSRQSRLLMAERYTWRALFIQMNKEITALLGKDHCSDLVYLS